MLKDSVITLLEDNKAMDLVVLDVGHLTTVTEHMIVCTGRSTRHVCAIGEDLRQEIKAMSGEACHVEGLEQGEWVLVDANAVVVHVMVAEMRQFYQLEKLWGDVWSGSAASDLV